MKSFWCLLLLALEARAISIARHGSHVKRQQHHQHANVGLEAQLEMPEYPSLLSDELRKMWRALDTNADGVLGDAELQAASDNELLRAEDLRMMTQLDYNGDGQISVAEYRICPLFLGLLHSSHALDPMLDAAKGAGPMPNIPEDIREQVKHILHPNGDETQADKASSAPLMRFLQHVRSAPSEEVNEEGNEAEGTGDGEPTEPDTDTDAATGTDTNKGDHADIAPDVDHTQQSSLLSRASAQTEAQGQAQAQAQAQAEARAEAEAQAHAMTSAEAAAAAQTDASLAERASAAAHTQIQEAAQAVLGAGGGVAVDAQFLPSLKIKKEKAPRDYPLAKYGIPGFFDEQCVLCQYCVQKCNYNLFNKLVEDPTAIGPDQSLVPSVDAGNTLAQEREVNNQILNMAGGKGLVRINTEECVYDFCAPNRLPWLYRAHCKLLRERVHSISNLLYFQYQPALVCKDIGMCNKLSYANLVSSVHLPSKSRWFNKQRGNCGFQGGSYNRTPFFLKIICLVLALFKA